MPLPLWTSEQAAAASHGKATTAWQADGIAIDSRSVQKGDLFFALTGGQVDGHRYVASALAQGAAAAIVNHIPANVDKTAPLLVVEDTIKALSALAEARRAESKAVIIGVTGSVGKTSTKEALRIACGPFGKTHATAGNFNNHLGVPITLCCMPKDTDMAVFEMGMNHAGELSGLSRQLRPHIAIITNIEAVHLEFFDSLAGIADAKAEIFEGLEGIKAVVLNRDNSYFDQLAAKAKALGITRIHSFGSSKEASCRLLSYQSGGESCVIKADIEGQVISYEIGVNGIHQAHNSLAVLAAIHAAGKDVSQAAEALRGFGAPKGRGKRYQIKHNFTLIDDSYNASPASVTASLNVLSQEKTTGRKIAILGDMLELGENGIALHRGLAEHMDGIDEVITVGILMNELQKILPAAKQGGHYTNVEALTPLVMRHIQDSDVVLIKGSHGVHMYRLVEALLANNDN